MVRYTLRQLFSVNAAQKRGFITLQYDQKILPTATDILEQSRKKKR
jgi:hypothetical protein